MLLLAHVLPDLVPHQATACIAARITDDGLVPVTDGDPSLHKLLAGSTTRITYLSRRHGVTVKELRCVAGVQPLSTSRLVWVLPPPLDADADVVPYYHVPWAPGVWDSPAARHGRSVLAALYPGTLQCRTLYHGTRQLGCAGILQEGAVRPALGSFMCGRGVYFGEFQKAMRFALYNHNHERYAPHDSWVVRCVVWMGDAVQVRGGKNTEWMWELPECACEKCVENPNQKMRRMVDHAGLWMQQPAAVGPSSLVYEPGPGMVTGKGGRHLIKTREFILHPRRTQQLPMDACSPEGPGPEHYVSDEWCTQCPGANLSAPWLNSAVLQAPLVPSCR